LDANLYQRQHQHPGRKASLAKAVHQQPKQPLQGPLSLSSPVPMLLAVSQLLHLQQLLCRCDNVVAKHLALVLVQSLPLLSLFFSFFYIIAESLF